MPSDYRFREKAIRRFEESHDLKAGLYNKKFEQIHEEIGIHLSVRELQDLLSHVNEKPISTYIREEAKMLSPLSLSLFVVNDALWKIVGRKNKHSDKMNPMITFPWFHWDTDTSGDDEQSHIIRESSCSGIEDITLEENMLTIEGLAGDFAGVLEERIVREEDHGRPIIIPKGFGSRKLVSKYNLERIKILVDLQLCKAQLYPTPDLSFDYRFSDDPEDIHNHGLRISSTEGGVALSSGGKSPATLKGTVTMFLCKRMTDLHESDISLKHHLWLVGLYELIEKGGFH